LNQLVLSHRVSAKTADIDPLSQKSSGSFRFGGIVTTGLKIRSMLTTYFFQVVFSINALQSMLPPCNERFCFTAFKSKKTTDGRKNKTHESGKTTAAATAVRP
jgi:hypothetical protein